MNIEGTWWYVAEEEAFDPESSVKWDLANGVVTDARTDEPRGTYEIEKDRIEIALTGKSYTIELGATEEHPTLLSGVERHPAVEDEGPMVYAATLMRAEAAVIPMPLFNAA